MRKNPERIEKTPTVESSKAERASIVKDYKNFEDIRTQFSTDEGLAKALGTDTKFLAGLMKNPQHAKLIRNVQSTALTGLATLLTLKAIKISKGADLVKIRRDLKRIRIKLKRILENWLKKHGKLKRLYDIETKRSDLLFGSVRKDSIHIGLEDHIHLKIIEVMEGVIEGIPTIDREDDVEEFNRIRSLIKSSSFYINFRKKIEKASGDQITYMYSDHTLFDDFNENLYKLIKLEDQRHKILESAEAHAFSTPHSIDPIGTEEDMYNATQEITNSEAYTELVRKIHTASYEELVKMDKSRDFFPKYEKRFRLTAYRYINRKQLDKQLTPYLKLKPKSLSDKQFLAVLEKNDNYQTALSEINTGLLAIQEGFDPKDYINFNKEQSKGATEEPSDNMYQFAQLQAKTISNKATAGKIVTDFNNLA